MADWRNILSEDDEQITGEELLKYLDDDISEEEKHTFEKKLNNPFNIDAVEGLSQIQNKESLKKHVGQLNVKLQQLTAKRPREQKQKIEIFEWMILALLITLFICVITFIIINLQVKGHVQTSTPSFKLICDWFKL